MHCNNEELRKDIRRYRNPTWIAVEQLAENYERSIVNEEPHKRWAKSNVRTIKREKRETAKQIRTLSSFKENASDVEARDTNLMIAN